jgi:hypothetical protein
MPNIKATDGPTMIQRVEELDDLSRFPNVVSLHKREKDLSRIEAMYKINEFNCHRFHSLMI